MREGPQIEALNDDPREQRGIADLFGDGIGELLIAFIVAFKLDVKETVEGFEPAEGFPKRRDPLVREARIAPLWVSSVEPRTRVRHA